MPRLSHVSGSYGHILPNLGLYVLGVLKDEERVLAESHLAGCPACRDAYNYICDVPRWLEACSPEDIALIEASGDVGSAQAGSLGPEVD